MYIKYQSWAGVSIDSDKIMKEPFADGAKVRFIQKSISSVVLPFQCNWAPEENQRVREPRAQEYDCRPH